MINVINTIKTSSCLMSRPTFSSWLLSGHWWDLEPLTVCWPSEAMQAVSTYQSPLPWDVTRDYTNRSHLRECVYTCVSTRREAWHDGTSCDKSSRQREMSNFNSYSQLESVTWVVSRWKLSGYNLDAFNVFEGATSSLEPRKDRQDHMGTLDRSGLIMSHLFIFSCSRWGSPPLRRMSASEAG